MSKYFPLLLLIGLTFWGCEDQVKSKSYIRLKWVSWDTTDDFEKYIYGLDCGTYEATSN
tara:strand:- start:300 stop:476 length:177 start_codon:yes stop_codon:yes gene_type:complete